MEPIHVIQAHLEEERDRAADPLHYEAKRIVELAVFKAVTKYKLRRRLQVLWNAGMKGAPNPDWPIESEAWITTQLLAQLGFDPTSEDPREAQRRYRKSLLPGGFEL